MIFWRAANNQREEGRETVTSISLCRRREARGTPVFRYSMYHRHRVDHGSQFEGTMRYDAHSLCMATII